MAFNCCHYLRGCWLWWLIWSFRLTSQLSKLISSAEQYGALRLVGETFSGCLHIFIFVRCEEQFSIQLETLSKFLVAIEDFFPICQSRYLHQLTMKQCDRKGPEFRTWSGSGLKCQKWSGIGPELGTRSGFGFGMPLLRLNRLVPLW